MSYTWPVNSQVYSVSGTYSSIGTNPAGCTLTRILLFTRVSQPSVNVITTNVNCNGNDNGTAKAVLTGGSGLFTYLWSGGQSVDSIGNLPGSAIGITYTVTVTDLAIGCNSSSGSGVVKQPAPLNLATAQTNINCFGASTGTANANTGGGTAPYFYIWKNSVGTVISTIASISGLSAGSYTVKVTDANGCTAQRTITITQTATPVSVTLAALSNYKMKATVTGGSPGYGYAWSGGSLISTTVAPYTQTRQGSANNYYTVTVTDSKGCKVVSPKVASSLTRIEDESSAELLNIFDVSVYPNPAADLFTVKFITIVDDHYTIEVMNYVGQLVAIKDGLAAEGENKVEFNGEMLAKGAYFVRIILNENKHQIITRLIME